MSWLRISFLLCVVGFVREIRPSEPFLTEFLAGPWRDITEEQLNRHVYPMLTYAYLAQLIVVFLITDFLLYKPLIITTGVMGIIVWSMLLWTTSFEALMILQFFFGTCMATEVAYYTYIYAKVDKKHYPKVTSHTGAAIFAGRFVGNISAQLLINYKVMDYRDLNYITLATQIFATLWAFVLPKVDKSLYFHRKTFISDKPVEISPSKQYIENCKSDDEKSDKLLLASPIKLLWTHFYNAYTNATVLQWSIYYAVGLCGFLQVTFYVQLLWKEIEPNPDIAWNGAVEAVFTALAAIFALAAGYLHAGRLKSRSSLLVLAILSALEGGSILLSCRTLNIYVSYVGYIVFGALYGFTVTVAGAEVARNLEEDSFGLVFGINTTIALLLQTILTVTLISENGFALSTKGQFTVCAFIFILIGIIYFILVMIDYFFKKQTKSHDLN